MDTEMLSRADQSPVIKFSIRMKTFAQLLLDSVPGFVFCIQTFSLAFEERDWSKYLYPPSLQMIYLELKVLGVHSEVFQSLRSPNKSDVVTLAMNIPLDD
jgi:hypothetical protein